MTGSPPDPSVSLHLRRQGLGGVHLYSARAPRSQGGVLDTRLSCTIGFVKSTRRYA